jgi:hypothetical protein
MIVVNTSQRLPTGTESDGNRRVLYGYNSKSLLQLASSFPSPQDKVKALRSGGHTVEPEK